MIAPDDWLRLANNLITAGRPSTAALRRSASTSYYAVFHAIAAAAALSMVGADRSRWRLVHRSVSHDRLRVVGAETLKAQPSREFAPYWPTEGFGSELRLLSSELLHLQQWRHAADYDPEAELDVVLALELASSAAVALDSLAAAPDSELALWLSLVILRPYSR